MKPLEMIAWLDSKDRYIAELEDVYRAAKEIVDSFTNSHDGTFIPDDLTRVEYDQLRDAVSRVAALDKEHGNDG